MEYMEFDYKRKLDRKELGWKTGKPYLNLVGNYVGRRERSVGDCIDKMITSFIFRINGTYNCGGQRKNTNHIYANFINEYELQEGDEIGIKFKVRRRDNELPLLIEIEIPEKKIEDLKKRAAKNIEGQKGFKII